MNLFNKKFLYVNGSSVSAGGGFEEYKFRTDIRDAYMDKGIELPTTQLECSYPYMIAKNLNLELINDSKSGSGIDRLIRTSMEFITNNLDKIDKTIFIFELQSGIRLDWYVEEWKDYGVLNASYNPYEILKNNTIYPFTLVKEWHTDDINEQTEWNQKYENNINGYFNNFFNHDVQFDRESEKVIMFISFLNQLNLDYLIAVHGEMNDIHKKIVNKILFKKNNLNSIFGSNFWRFSEFNSLQIRNEVNHSDNHLGYFGNKKISKIITNYIKNQDTYIIPTYKIFTNDDFTLLNTFFTNTDIILQKTTNIANSDCILLTNLDRNFFNETDIETIFNLKTQLKNVELSNKKFLLVYFHEKMNSDIFEKKIDFLTQTLNINKNQIVLIDSCINKIDNIEKEVPVEFKIKQYSEYYPDKFYQKRNFVINEYRNKKFTFLMGKDTIERVYTFDKILHFYQDIVSLQKDNVIGINSKYYLKKYNYKLNFNLNTDVVNSLNLPWILDYPSDIFKLNKQDAIIHKRYSDSVFSIVNETKSEYEPCEFSDDFLVDDSIKFTNFQISEKSILPILNGNLPFIIHDGLIYEKLEEVGFDFSYLKNIFGIEYKTNSFKQNVDSIELFINYIKSKSIEQLNELRNDNIKYIENNINVIVNIFEGYLSERELNYLKWLFNERDTLY